VTAAEVLKALRARGYTVALESGVVTATGATPKDPERAAALLQEHQASLRLILEAEQILGGRLK